MYYKICKLSDFITFISYAPLFNDIDLFIRNRNCFFSRLPFKKYSFICLLKKSHDAEKFAYSWDCNYKTLKFYNFKLGSELDSLYIRKYIALVLPDFYYVKKIEKN